MLSVLFVTARDINIGVAKRVAYEGHIVKVFNTDGFQGKDYTGIRRVRDLDGCLESSDLVIFGTPEGAGRIYQRVVRDGRLALGGSVKGELFLTDEDLRATLWGAFYDEVDEREAIQVYVSFVKTEDEFVEGKEYVTVVGLRLMDGERGPVIMNDGMVGATYPAQGTRLVQDVKRQVKGVFDGIGGIVSVPLQVDQKAFCMSKRMPLFGLHWGSILELECQDVGKTLYRMAKGESWARPGNRRVAVYTKLLNVGDAFRMVEGAEKHVWFGVNSMLVTAWGDGIDEACRRVRRTLNNCVGSLDVIYRVDHAGGFAKKLAEWGWFDAVEEREEQRGSFVEHSRAGEGLQADGKDWEYQSGDFGEGKEGGYSDCV